MTLTLVLLPGMDGTGQLFEPLVTALGDEFVISVVRYPTDEPLGYGELASIVRAALPRQGSFVLVGESFSGPIAISVAASRPSGLVGMVLACTFARNPRPQLVFLKSLIGLLPASRVPTVCMGYFLLGRFSTEGLRSICTSLLVVAAVFFCGARPGKVDQRLSRVGELTTCQSQSPSFTQECVGVLRMSLSGGQEALELCCV